MKLLIYGKIEEDILKFLDKEQIINIDESIKEISNDVDYIICLERDIDKIDILISLCKLHNKGIIFFISVLEDTNVEELANLIICKSKCLHKKSIFLPIYSVEQNELHSILAFLSVIDSIII